MNGEQHKQELFKKLQQLGIAFALMVAALVIASAWTAIASGAGLMPSVEKDGPRDDGVDEDGNDIPGANPNGPNGIDDSTEQLSYFITGIVKWITGLAGAFLAIGLVIIAVMHAKETDPNKRD